MVGVDWTARIVSLKVSTDAEDSPVIFHSSLYQALGYAYSRYKFINLSLGGTNFGEWASNRTDEMVYRNLFMNGVLVVAATGNQGIVTTVSPALYTPYVTAVGAMSSLGTRWRDQEIPWGAWFYYSSLITNALPTSGSNGASYIWMVAPGGRFVPVIQRSAEYRIPNTSLLWFPGATPADHGMIDPYSPYLGFGGTSAAAPMVTGAAALVRSVVGDSLGNQEIRHLLALTAFEKGAAGWDNVTGWGTLDLRKLMNAAKPGSLAMRGYAEPTYVDSLPLVLGTTSVPSNGWPALPIASYTAKEFRVRCRAMFSPPFATQPYGFARTMGSRGSRSLPSALYTPESPHPSYSNSPPRWEHGCDTLATYPDSLILQTRIYRITKIKPPGSNEPDSSFWWPCPPASATCAWTALGIPAAALDAPPTPGNLLCTLRIESVRAHPSQGEVEFSLRTAAPGPVDFELLDVAGRVLARRSAHAVIAGVNPQRLLLRQDSNRLRAGLYFIRVTKAAERASAKLVWTP